jgi:selenocysteine lyase/cysteine desulfurase
MRSGRTSAALDVARLRADTPGTASVIHFNNAGASLPPRVVTDTQIAHLEREAAIGGYEAAGEARERLAAVRASVATLLGAGREEVALTENATVAWLHAFHAVTRDLGPGNRILTCEADYAANYVSLLQIARRRGVEIVVVPSDDTGTLDLEALDRALDERVKLVTLTHVPTNGGLVNPAAEVGARARAAGIPYLLDACQAAGQMPLDVDAIGCDFLSATGRKYLRGPRGTGFLYVRASWAEALEPAWIDHTGAPWDAQAGYRLLPGARRFELFESSIAARLGLGAALDYALALGIDAIWQRIRALATELRAALEAVPGVTVTDLGRERCGIVTFSVAGRTSRAVQALLGAHRINVTTPPPDSTPLDHRNRDVRELVRASVHCYNTSDEIDTLVSVLANEGGRS